MSIRAATCADLDAVLALLRELAAFEGGSVSASVADLEAGFTAGRIEALVAEQDGEIVGLLTALPTFSSWRGQAGVVIHDLYVRPLMRGQGWGQRLVRALMTLAPTRGWTRIDVNVLEWNQPAQAFYRALGLAPAPGWQIWRIEGEALENRHAVQ